MRGAWYGGAFAGEYQYGVFNVFILALDYVLWLFKPTPVHAAETVALVYLGIMAAGTVRLARLRGFQPAIALAAGCGLPLTGWILGWGASSWHPAIGSFAFVPWTLWAYERATNPDRGPLRFVTPAVFLYLVLTAGWPFTVLIIGLLTALTCLKTLDKKGSAVATWPVFAALALGLALSAPAFLVLSEYSKMTIRSNWPPELNWHWTVPATALPGFIVPSFSAVWEWNGPVQRTAAELTGGLLPVAGLLVGLRYGRAFFRSCRWELIGLLIALLLCTGPGFQSFRWSFRWLPLAALELIMIGASGLNIALLNPRKIAANPGVVIAAVIAIVSMRDLLRSYDAAETTRVLGPQLFYVALAWAAAWALPLSSRTSLAAWSAPGVVLVTTWLTASALPLRTKEFVCHHFGTKIATMAPFAPGIRYYVTYDMSDIRSAASDPEVKGPIARPGNMPMLAGVETINGYSPLGPLGVHDLLGLRSQGATERETFARLVAQEVAGHGLLDMAGVDGIALAPSFASSAQLLTSSGKWRIASTTNAGMVLHRVGEAAPRARCVRSAMTVQGPTAVLQRSAGDSGTAPIVLLDEDGSAERTEMFADCHVLSVTDSRLTSAAYMEVSGSNEGALLVFARPWVPGWTASLNGRALQVGSVDLLFPGVRVPAGAHGRVVLEYRPKPLMRGLGLAGLGIALTAAVAGAMRLRRSPATKQLARTATIPPNPSTPS